MGFLNIPNELIYHIVGYIEADGDINALVQTNRSRTVRLFLQEGASPTTCFRENWNPMMLAAKHGHKDIVELFLKEGIDPTPMSGWGNPQGIYIDACTCPFDQAVMHGHEGVARVLVLYMKNVDYFVLPEFGEHENWATPLTWAAKSGCLGLVRMFIEEFRCNVDPNRFEKKGRAMWPFQSPLAVAALEDHTNVARYLLRAGADPNACNQDTTTACGRDTVVRRLLLDMDPKERDWEEALMNALFHGDTTVLNLFLDQGLEFNDRGQNALLLWAAAKG
ncbi:hypothetical protein FE257_009034 [Aspergillus nanangensis]|uniref:Ankyrin n=1 Tax=Aspergillus nanangensis TaxID=2582783 RepID=A0AAD4CWK9_ASPNN|nr:hypothetical protein FE257_009034 [Aspergillus nanangensis]